MIVKQQEKGVKTTSMRSDFGKEACINKLIEKIKICTNECKHMSNIIAGRPESAAKGIGYWSDAFPYYNAKLMIVGQDWGNEEYVSRFGKFPEEYKEYREKGNPTWENLMRNLEYAGFNLHGGDIYLTNALLCARTGEMTGNSAIDKASFTKCFNYLKEQVDIIKPVVIAALGQLVFDVLNENLDIRYRYKKFADIVAMVKSNPDALKTKDNVTLYPLYHTGAYGTMNRKKARVDGDILDDFISLRKVVYNGKL